METQIEDSNINIKTELLSQKEKTEVIADILRGEDDETISPLVARIDDQTKREGLNSQISTMGVSRFLSFNNAERRKIMDRQPFVKRDGTFMLVYTIGSSEERQEAAAKGGVMPIDVMGKTHYDPNRDLVRIGAEPINIGKQIANYIVDAHIDENVIGVRKSLESRIHECAHRYNSEGLNKDQYGSVVGNIFREAHSCLVVQAYNINYLDKDFIDIWTQEHGSSEKPNEEEEEYYKNYGTHKEAVFSDESKDMAGYAVDVIWQLRALGYDEKAVGEMIVKFQRTNMLDWSNDTRNCPTIEKWLQQQWSYKGVVWKKTSLEHPVSIESEVAKTREKFERNTERVKQICIETSQDFLSTRKEPSVVFVNSFRGNKKIDCSLPDGIDVKPGEIVRVTYDPPLPNSPESGRKKIEIINLRENTRKSVDVTDIDEAWFDAARKRYFYILNLNS